MSKYPTPTEAEAIYSSREAAIGRLGQQSMISVADLNDLDRLGRFRVADELWHKCPDETRQQLRNDEHPHVRSAARWADQQQDTLPADSIRRLMRQNKVTIRALAARMNITMKRVRDVRENGVSGKCMCQDWREAITGTGIFATTS